jgi:hypothetical protein
MKILINIIFTFLIPNILAASSSADISFGLGSIDPNRETLTAISVKINRNYKLEEKIFNGVLILGGGIRATNYRSSFYQTQSGIVEVVERFRINSFNLLLESQIKWEKIFIGFNIDVLGYSFQRESTIQNSNSVIRNVKFNLLRGGKNDKGTLNSQIYLGYQIDSVYTQVGLSHSAIEFEGKVANSTVDRQNFVDTLFLEVGYQF